MWWININGNVDGPFSSEQIEKRVKLNMLRSLDCVSKDKLTWSYVKDTDFWNTEPIIKPSPPPPPPPPAQQPRRQSRRRVDDSEVDWDQGEKRTRGIHVPILVRTENREGRQSSIRFDRVLWVVLVTSVLVALTGMVIMVRFVTNGSRSVSPPRTDVAVPSSTTDSNKSSPPATGFNAIKDKLAIIDCKESSGTGFILEMGGKTYLMTNEHVVRSADTPQVRLLDGTPLELGAFSVATDRDLARFEIKKCPVAPLQISDKLPNTGDIVAAYGNSLGSGVATESKGFIQGVGHLRLETNCEIVPGNSGGPIVAADGKVIGVAALIDRHGSDDWTVKNTRYESAPRRFAVRFAKVEWKAIARSRYEQQVAVLREHQVYWGHLRPYLCLDIVDVAPDDLVFNDLKAKDFQLSANGYVEMLNALSKAYKKRTKCLNQYLEQRDGRSVYIRWLAGKEIDEEDAKCALQEYDQKTCSLFEKVKNAFRDMIHKRREALELAKGVLRDNAWDAPQILSGYSKDDSDRRGSVEWYLEGVQYFMDLMNQKLKDLNKEIEEIEKGGNDDEDD